MASSAAPASATVLVPAVTSAPAPSPAAHPPLAPVANPTPSPSADPAPAAVPAPAPALVAAPAPPPAPVAAPAHASAAAPAPAPAPVGAPAPPPASVAAPAHAPAVAPAPAPTSVAAPAYPHVAAPAHAPAPVAAPAPPPASVVAPAPAPVANPPPAADPIHAPTLAPSAVADPAPTPTPTADPAPAADPVPAPAPAADPTLASAKPKPLHNFELPELWNKDGQASVLKKRRSSIKSPSPSQRVSAPPVSLPPPQEPVLTLRPQEPISMSPPLPRIQSPMKDSFKLSSDDILVPDNSRIKQSSICKESRKSSPNDEERKKLPPVGFDYSEKLSLLRAEIQRHFEKRNPSLESEALAKGKGGLTEYRRNHSKNSPFPIFNTGASSSEKTYEKKLGKRFNPTEDDESGNKKPKISIKIPSKNRKEDEQSSKERLLKTGITDNHNEINEARRGEGKLDINWDYETRLWDLRPRKPKSKLEKVTVDVAKKSNVPKLPEKNKAEPQMKKNMSDGHERDEKEEKLSEKNEKGEKKEKRKKPDKEKKKERDEKSEKKDAKSEKEKGGLTKEKKKLSISISLTKEEIEEDIFAFTGSKPTRRPKKRAKNVQKQLDSVFPGLWLASISPDSYKVSESSMKG